MSASPDSTSRPLDRATPGTVRAAAPRVLVVGDAILDGWWQGTALRLSREAPAPVVEIDDRRWRPGGAANTAMNLAALGARVRLVGRIGDDDAGARLTEMLQAAGVGLDGVVRDPVGETNQKVRILSGDQILVRADSGARRPSDPALARRIAEAAAEAAREADVIVVCDYGAGDLREVPEALRGVRRRPFTIVDAHDLRAWRRIRPNLVTPNADEAAGLVGPLGPGDRIAQVVARAAAILNASGARRAVVTLDREGTVLVGDDGLEHRTHARPEVERHASGAGDTFTAALAAGIGAGLPIGVALDLAQCAADVVVRRPGTAVCGTADLEERWGETPAVVSHLEELQRRLRDERADGRRVVFTNGCFDVLHRGHTGYLHEAKQQGDVLVVAVNSDASVRRLKGPDRPVNTAADRAAVIAALGCVDYVIVFDTDTPIPLLKRLRPDVYVKGGDYTPDMLAEAPVVQGYGGEVRILGYIPDQSTTSVLDRIRTGGALIPEESR